MYKGNMNTDKLREALSVLDIDKAQLYTDEDNYRSTWYAVEVYSGTDKNKAKLKLAALNTILSEVKNFVKEPDDAMYA